MFVLKNGGSYLKWDEHGRILEICEIDSAAKFEKEDTVKIIIEHMQSSKYDKLSYEELKVDKKDD